MKLTRAVFLLALACFMVPAQSKRGLPGAWRVTEATLKEVTNTAPAPGLILFTEKYYSLVTDNAGEPRPDLPADAATATAAQLNATWGPFSANSGTYEVVGNTVTLRPVVAQTPASMRSGGFTAYAFKLEGDMLSLTPTKTYDGKVALRRAFKLIRVE